LIGRLSGRIVEDSAEGIVVLDVGGVGYEVTVPLGALGRASRDESGVVTLYVHTHVREDMFALYGFPTRDDRAAFRALIGVSSVGPKIAMAILGGLTAGELASVIARGEVARLVAVPGSSRENCKQRPSFRRKERLLQPLFRKVKPICSRVRSRGWDSVLRKRIGRLRLWVRA
jgi:Holliday junction DNA helicase RuvA